MGRQQSVEILQESTEHSIEDLQNDSVAYNMFDKLPNKKFEADLNLGANRGANSESGTGFLSEESTHDTQQQIDEHLNRVEAIKERTPTASNLSVTSNLGAVSGKREKFGSSSNREANSPKKEFHRESNKKSSIWRSDFKGGTNFTLAYDPYLHREIVEFDEICSRKLVEIDVGRNNIEEISVGSLEIFGILECT